MKVNPTNEVPPGGWRYKDPETGVWIMAHSYGELLPKVRLHRTVNNLPIPTNLAEQVDTQVCDLLPPQWCERERPRNYDPQPLTLSQVLQGTLTLLDWAKNGRELVSQEEATRRAFICARCHFNQDISGCASCSKRAVLELVGKIVGASATPHDDRLYGCTVCGCNLRAKVWFKLDTLLAHTPAEQLNSYPEFCWLKHQ